MKFTLLLICCLGVACAKPSLDLRTLKNLLATLEAKRDGISEESTDAPSSEESTDLPPFLAHLGNFWESLWGDHDDDDTTYQPPRPTGQPPRPSGKPPRPSGKPPRPSGKPPRPSGQPPKPSGQPPKPSGQPPRPSGEPPKRSLDLRTLKNLLAVLESKKDDISEESTDAPSSEESTDLPPFLAHLGNYWESLWGDHDDDDTTDQPPRPTGQPPRPSGKPPRPSGKPPRPSGKPPRPSGQPPKPSGQPPRPSGQPPKRNLDLGVKNLLAALESKREMTTGEPQKPTGPSGLTEEAIEGALQGPVFNLISSYCMAPGEFDLSVHLEALFVHLGIEATPLSDDELMESLSKLDLPGEGNFEDRIYMRVCGGDFDGPFEVLKYLAPQLPKGVVPHLRKAALKLLVQHAPEALFSSFRSKVCSSLHERLQKIKVPAPLKALSQAGKQIAEAIGLEEGEFPEASEFIKNILEHFQGPFVDEVLERRGLKDKVKQILGDLKIPFPMVEGLCLYSGPLEVADIIKAGLKNHPGVAERIDKLKETIEANWASYGSGYGYEQVTGDYSGDHYGPATGGYSGDNSGDYYGSGTGGYGSGTGDYGSGTGGYGPATGAPGTSGSGSGF